MSAEFDPSKVDLVVVITRIHADRGSSDDEFERDWAPPGAEQGDASGVVQGSSGAQSYWVRAENRRAGVLVLHGYKGLFSGEPGNFEDVILQNIDQSGLKNCSLSTVAIFVHGDLLSACSATARSPYPIFLQRCQKLAKRFRGGQNIYDYNLQGKLPASLELPKALRAQGIDPNIRKLADMLFNIVAAVELIVRSMQHIILEIRLWCDLYNHKGNQDVVKARLSDCLGRLMDADHWDNAHACKARSYLCDVELLETFLAIPSQELFRLDSEDDAGPLKASLSELYEQHGGASFLDCERTIMDALLRFLGKGEPPDSEQKAPDIDRGLRSLSARLEALIPAAVAVDGQRGTAS